MVFSFSLRFARWIPAFAGMTPGVALVQAKDFIIPAKAGIQGNLSPDIIVEVTPLGVYAFDKLNFPSSFPFLDLLLTRDRGLHRAVQLDIDQPVNAVSFRETSNEAFLMLPNPRDGIAGDACVQRAIPSACEDVHARLSVHGWLDTGFRLPLE